MTTAEYNTVSFPNLGFDFVAKSTAFTIFGLEIKWYGIFIVTGIILAILYASKRMEKTGVDGERAFDAIIWGIIGAIIGARLYYVLSSWDNYRDDPVSIFYIRDGGLAIYGGLIGALLFGGIAAKIRKVHLPPLFDLAGLGFLIGQAIGRWGNLFNHECFGSNTDLPWAMTSPKVAAQINEIRGDVFLETGVELSSSLPVHPCFLYESLWCVLGFVLLHFYSKRKKFDGEIFLMYLGWYGLGRMFIEGLRTDSLMIGSFRISQILAGVCLIVSVAAILVLRRKVTVDGYTFYKDTDDFKAKLAETNEKLKAYEDKKRAKKEKKSTALNPDDKIVSAEESDNITTVEENENGESN